MNIRLPGFVSFLFQRSRSVMAAMVCVGVLSGLCSAGVLALINRVLQQRHDQEGFLALGFVAVVAGKLATQVVSQLTLRVMACFFNARLFFCCFPPPLSRECVRAGR